MHSIKNKSELNAPGKYYVDRTECIDCQICQEEAHGIFSRFVPVGVNPNDPMSTVLCYSYVSKQPRTFDEEARCQEAMWGCPAEAIGDDGAQPASLHEDDKFITRTNIQTILRAVGNAIYNNQTNPVPDMPNDASLVVHMIRSFGFQPGDEISQDVLEQLLKAQSFTITCVTSKWIQSDEKGVNVLQMPVNNWDKVEELFRATFNEQDLTAFGKVCNLRTP